VVVVRCTNLAFLGAPHCRWWKYQMYQVINSFFCFEVMFLKTIGCELMRIRILCFCDYHLVMTNIAMENCPFIDCLPIKHGDFPWLWNNQMVNIITMALLRSLLSEKSRFGQDGLRASSGFVAVAWFWHITHKKRPFFVNKNSMFQAKSFLKLLIQQWCGLVESSRALILGPIRANLWVAWNP